MENQELKLGEFYHKLMSVDFLSIQYSFRMSLESDKYTVVLKYIYDECLKNKENSYAQYLLSEFYTNGITVDVDTKLAFDYPTVSHLQTMVTDNVYWVVYFIKVDMLKLIKKRLSNYSLSQKKMEIYMGGIFRRILYFWNPC